MDINTYTEARAKEIEKSGNARLDEERRGHERTINNLTGLLEKLNREQLICSETRAAKLRQRLEIKINIENLDAAKAGLHGQLTGLRRRIDATQQQIGGRDPLGRYGQNLQAVKQEIGKRTWKRGPPIGPLGMFVKLKPGEDRYKTLLTGLLSNVLVSWGVQDPADRKQLLDIFRLCVRQRGT
jgi:chromosome segregation ATPase